METRRIGSLEVPVLGLGANNFGARVDEERSVAVLKAALDAGITFIDTADVYGETKSEQIIGKTLGSRRDEVVLATKFGMPHGDLAGGGKAAYVRLCLESSLKRLQTDRIDLFIFHRPDPQTPISETLGALDDLRREGKIREIGCSNFSFKELEEANAAASPGAARFVNLQNEFSLLHREVESEILPYCIEQDIAFVPYFPLAGGLLTGKYRPDEPPPTGTRMSFIPEDRRGHFLNSRNFQIVEALQGFAVRYGRPLGHLAIAWILAQQGVASVIAGATTLEQVASNVGATTWQLTEDDLREIEELAPPS